MHPALRKLLRLRLRGTMRRMFRGLKTVRGAVFSVVGLLLMTVWLGPTLFMATSAPEFDPEVVRSIAPVALLLFCLISILTSGGQKAVHFTGEEIDFLFSGPFSRRQLLLYKLTASTVGAAFAAMIFSLLYLQYTRFWIASLLGFWLSMMLVQLFSTAAVLIGQTVAEHAYTRFRRATLILVLLVAALAVWKVFSDVGGGGFMAMAQWFGNTWVGFIVLAPFDVFGRTITAETLFPELLGWGSLALAINVGLLVLVLRLDVNYMESAIAVSQKIYRRMQQIRRGGGVAWTGKKDAKFGLPRLPRLSGAGPIVRRQMTHAFRGAKGLFIFLAVMAVPCVVIASQAVGSEENMPLPMFAGFLIPATIFLTRMVPFDFRGDLDHIDWLKSLPISSTAVAVGQLLTPTAIMTALHVSVLVVAALIADGSTGLLLMLAAFTLPFNFLLFGLENLLFLLAPTRLMPTTPGDLQHVGRTMVEVMLKMFLLALCCGLAAGAGAIAYLFFGSSWVIIASVSWLTLATIAAGIVPCVAWAYRRFDVSIDTPP